MGLGKWWIKHGPGSAGSIAKAMAKDFMRWKHEEPSATKEELLFCTLSVRMASHKIFGLEVLSVEEQIELIRKCDSDLVRIIQYIIHMENPTATEVMFTFPELYKTMLDVIIETVNKYAPGA